MQFGDLIPLKATPRKKRHVYNNVVFFSHRRCLAFTLGFWYLTSKKEKKNVPLPFWCFGPKKLKTLKIHDFGNIVMYLNIQWTRFSILVHKKLKKKNTQMTRFW